MVLCRSALVDRSGTAAFRMRLEWKMLRETLHFVGQTCVSERRWDLNGRCCAKPCILLGRRAWVSGDETWMEDVARNLAFCWADVREWAENNGRCCAKPCILLGRRAWVSGEWLACLTGANIVALARNPARKVRAVELRSQTFVVLLLV